METKYSNPVNIIFRYTDIAFNRDILNEKSSNLLSNTVYISATEADDVMATILATINKTFYNTDDRWTIMKDGNYVSFMHWSSPIFIKIKIIYSSNRGLNKY